MTRNKLLKELLNHPGLKENFWKDEDVEKYNINTIQSSTNKYIKALAYLIPEQPSTKYAKSNIQKLFNL